MYIALALDVACDRIKAFGFAQKPQNFLRFYVSGENTIELYIYAISSCTDLVQMIEDVILISYNKWRVREDLKVVANGCSHVEFKHMTSTSKGEIVHVH